MDYDPDDHARLLYRENLWLRELATLVARDLEGLASRESYASHTRPLIERAQQIRKRLWEGVPNDWRGER